ETRKILGQLEGEALRRAAVVVSATCPRVNVMDGHTETVSVSLGRRADLDGVMDASRSCAGDVPVAHRPSAPESRVHVRTDRYRPQPRLDRGMGGGMTTVVGRVREEPVLPAGVKYILLSRNTKMGAAKGAVFVAEMLIRDGYIGGS